MDEQRIRKIVQDELRRSQGAGRFGINQIPFHTHDGTNSQQIKAENIIPSTSVTGSITFAQATTYRIGLNASFTPRNIQTYGIVTGTDGGVVRVITIGSAQLTPTFYLQPNDDTSVVTGNLQFPFNGKPAQSSCYLSVERGGTSDFYAQVSEDHIVSVAYSGVKARATVMGYSRNEVFIDVPFLESGWEIILNFVIT